MQAAFMIILYLITEPTLLYSIIGPQGLLLLLDVTPNNYYLSRVD